jgi:putative transposase
MPVGARGVTSHLDGLGLVQYVVFRLADSLPPGIKEEIAKTPAVDRVKAVDASLDRGCGRRDLAIPEIVERVLLQFDGERYSMIAWCVMPNHVHT